MSRDVNSPVVDTGGATDLPLVKSSAPDRRRLLICLGQAVAWITVTGATVGVLPQGRGQEKAPRLSGRQRWSDTHPLPNSGDEVQPVPGTRSEFTPLETHFRMDNESVPPSIKEGSWKLRVQGLVERPLALALGDIRKYEPTHQLITLACITNPLAGDLVGTTRWTGVSLQRILQEARPRPNASHLKIRSADGYYEIVAMDTVRRDSRVMLAYEWDGLPLSAAHGFPLRIYIPDLYGMKLPKWIQSIEFMDHSEKGYWGKRGWDDLAHVRATAVIDAVGAKPGTGLRDEPYTIPIGGIANAGARGISKVQVQVDQGPWQDARLRAPLSATTWVLWRFEWPFKPGRHTFTVRCFEADGKPQIVRESPPNPSGATGLHRIQKTL